MSVSDDPVLSQVATGPRRAVILFSSSAANDLPRRGPIGRGKSLWRKLFEHAHRQASGAGVDLHVFHEGERSEFPLVSGTWHAQNGTCFATRLHHALRTLFDTGYDQVVVIGHDVPHIQSGTIRRAFAALGHSPVVLGPDDKGGCYLLGFQRQDAHWIESIAWRRNTDCRQIQALRGRRFVSVLDDTLTDIDSSFDLADLDLRALPSRLVALLRSIRGRILRTRVRCNPKIKPFLAAAHATIRFLQIPPPFRTQLV